MFLSLLELTGLHGQEAIPEKREMKKNEIQFIPQRHALSMSFDNFVVTYRVTNVLPKLIHMLVFSMEKNKFPFFSNTPVFRVLPGQERKPSKVLVEKSDKVVTRKLLRKA